MAAAGAAEVFGGNFLVTTEQSPLLQRVQAWICVGETERGGVLTGPFCAAGPELSPLSISGGADPTGPFTSVSDEVIDNRTETRMTNRKSRPKGRAVVSHLSRTRKS